MADEKLPSEFDAIVLGTGLTESIVAAALSRIGKKVLHLDRNQYYGGQWATFSFEEFLSWAELQNFVDNEKETTETNALSVPVKDCVISNIIIESYIKDDEELKPEVEGEPDVKETTSESNEDNVKEQTTTASNPSRDGDDYSYGGDSSSAQVVQPELTQLESPDNDGKNAQMSTDESGETADDTALKSPSISESDDNTVDKSDETEEQEVGNQIESSENETNEPVETSISAATKRLISQAKLASHSNEVTLQDFLCLSRKFSMDIAPNLMYARGPLIEILINANICHYAEFRTADRILTLKGDEIMDVPCSRADVFNSEMVSVIEKRFLMKFLSFCLTHDENPEQYEEFSDRPFEEFLKHKKLSSNLQHFVIYSMAMVQPQTDTVTGLRETQKFLVSLGRYSNSPFILALYGVGEIPQAFCRMSAVFGGLYCLRRSAKQLMVNQDDNSFKGIVCSKDQEINAKHLIMDKTYLPQKYQMQPSTRVSRAIIITNKSLKQSEDEQVTLMNIPPLTSHTNHKNVRIIEVGPSSMVCPIGLFVVHFTCDSTDTAYNDLKSYVRLLFEEFNVTESTKPKILWSAYFNQDGVEMQQVNSNLPRNIFVTNLPGATLGFANAIREARDIFDQICPGCEFLPAVPNPEDIIWDDSRKELSPGGTIATNEEDESGEDDTIDNQAKIVEKSSEGQNENGACCDKSDVVTESEKEADIEADAAYTKDNDERENDKGKDDEN